MRQQNDNFYLNGKPGRTATVNGSEFLFFSGYNYLGINADAEFIELVLEGTGRYGWLFPSSRISNTRLAVYEECEALLSAITGTQATVLLPSGFAAGRVASSYHGRVVHNAPGSHPAIMRNPSACIDFDAWRSWVLQQAGTNSSNEPLFIATDSVNPLTASIHNFDFLNQVSSKVVTIIDDSHGAGIIGNNGNGASGIIPQNKNVEYLLSYSLSKAFGIAGGAISCTAERAAAIKNTAEYSGVTPISPAQVYAFNKGQHIYARQLQKLKDNIAYFETCIQNLPDVKHTNGFPVFVLPAYLNESVIYNSGILISSFAYPDPNGETLKRVVLNALHTTADMDRLVDVLQKSY